MSDRPGSLAALPAAAAGPAPTAAAQVPRQAITRKPAPSRAGGRSDRVVRWSFKARDRCRSSTLRRLIPFRRAGDTCPRPHVVSAPAP
jgi:hypothetical protein